MNLQSIFTNTVKLIKSNSPLIFTALGIGGVLTTSYFVAKGSFEAADILISEDNLKSMPNKEKVKTVWKCYIPAGISGVATIGCIVCSSRASNNRTVAAITAYSLTERAFSEYREQVAEQFGKGKEQKVRDEIAKDRVAKRPVGSQEIIIAGSGHVLCCELYTNRYFRSDMEKLKRSQNTINAKILSELYVALDELYELLGLDSTSNSSMVGWDSDKLLELEFSTTIADNDEPCLTFNYNYVKPLK
jgi:hypothetical protein